jgi:hypothetical protein
MTTWCHFILLYDYTLYSFRKGNLYIIKKRVYIFKYNDNAEVLVFTSQYVTLNIDKTNLSLLKCNSTAEYKSLYKCHLLRNLRQLVFGYVKRVVNLDVVGTVR